MNLASETTGERLKQATGAAALALDTPAPKMV